LAAVTQNGRAFGHASAELRADHAVMLAAATLKIEGWPNSKAPVDRQADREVLLAVLKRCGPKRPCPKTYQWKGELVDLTQHWNAAPKEWLSDREIMLAAVTRDGNLLKHASIELGPTRRSCWPP